MENGLKKMMPYLTPEEAKQRALKEGSENSILNVGDIPKELEIYARTEASFLPSGKTFEELTKEELEELKSRYRFSPFRPGLYQTITGKTNGSGELL